MESLDIERMGTEQLIGQMLLMRNPVDREDFEFVLDLVRNRSLGGIHVSHKYVRDGYYVKDERAILDKVLEAADYPILVCEDMESGFPKGAAPLPFQMAVGASGSEELAYEYGRVTAIEARKAGYNLVFGPVLDIAENPRSCCVGSRSFGSSKELVARLGSAAVRGYQDQGMVVTAKHFPGFGESAVDNHIGMVHLSGDEESILEHEMYPYLHAIKYAGLSGVMMGHVMVPRIDPRLPASISPAMIGLLRGAGFQGLVVSDSLAMVGLTNRFPIGECHALAMMAGNDMVMTSYRVSAREALGYMLDAHRAGLVDEAAIRRAASRVAAAQRRTLAGPAASGMSERDAGAARRIAEKAVAARLDGVDRLPLDTEERRLFIVQEGVIFEDPLTGAVKREACDLEAAVETLKSRFRNSDFAGLPEFPAKPQLEHVMAKTLGYRSVVLVLANKSVSYTGSSDATRRMLSVLDGLREKLDAVLLFGCPYAAREFGRVRRIVFGFDGAECQRHAALCLAGERVPVGVLPVELP